MVSCLKTDENALNVSDYRKTAVSENNSGVAREGIRFFDQQQPRKGNGMMRQAKNGPESFPPSTDASIMEKLEIMCERLVRTANGRITIVFPPYSWFCELSETRPSRNFFIETKRCGKPFTFIDSQLVETQCLDFISSSIEKHIFMNFDHVTLQHLLTGLVRFPSYF